MLFRSIVPLLLTILPSALSSPRKSQRKLAKKTDSPTSAPTPTPVIPTPVINLEYILRSEGVYNVLTGVTVPHPMVMGDTRQRKLSPGIESPGIELEPSVVGSRIIVNGDVTDEGGHSSDDYHFTLDCTTTEGEFTTPPGVYAPSPITGFSVSKQKCEIDICAGAGSCFYLRLNEPWEASYNFGTGEATVEDKTAAAILVGGTGQFFNVVGEATVENVGDETIKVSLRYVPNTNDVTSGYLWQARR